MTRAECSRIQHLPAFIPVPGPSALYVACLSGDQQAVGSHVVVSHGGLGCRPSSLWGQRPSGWPAGHGGPGSYCAWLVGQRVSAESLPMPPLQPPGGLSGAGCLCTKEVFFTRTSRGTQPAAPRAGFVKGHRVSPPLSEAETANREHTCPRAHEVHHHHCSHSTVAMGSATGVKPVPL